MSDRRCSDPDCPHPERTSKRKFKDGRLRPSWRTDGNGLLLCNACDLRKRRLKKKLLLTSTSS